MINIKRLTHTLVTERDDDITNIDLIKLSYLMPVKLKSGTSFAKLKYLVGTPH